MMWQRSSKGSAAADVVIGVAVIVLVVLPVFSAVIERYIVLNKAQIIKDAVDMANISAYNAINAGNLSRNAVTFDSDKADEIYRFILAKNLHLDDTLSAKPNSIVEGTVNIESLILYTGGFPLACPEGTYVEKPSVHSCITVPVKPALYRRIILDLLGRQHIELKVHVDSEIPVNN